MINLKLDKNGGINKGDIVVSEHDNKSEEYIIQLIKNNNILDISNKSVIMTIINKETKEGDILNLSIYNAKEGQVKLEVTSNLTKCNGEYIAKIKLKDSTGYEESFPIFDIIIDIDLVEEISGEIIQNPTFTILNTSLVKVQEWDNYFKEVAPILENKYTQRLTNIENKVTVNEGLLSGGMVWRKDLETEDLNSISKWGVYLQSLNINATPQRNYPTEKAGCLEVMVGNGHIYQRYTTYAQDRTIYIRGFYGDSWSTWVKQDNAITLSGKKISNGNNVLDRIAYVGGDGGMGVGKFIDFHHVGSDNDFDGRLVLLDTKMFEFTRPLSMTETHSKYLVLRTYPNYGNEIATTIWVDNREGAQKLVLDNIYTLIVPNGRVVATSFDSTSDIRCKNVFNNEVGENNLDKVKKITPKYFEFLNDKDHKKHFGFIAQEVENLIPTAITTNKSYEGEQQSLKDKNGNTIKDQKSINIIDLVATLWGAVKELSTEVEKLKKQIIK